MVKMALSQITIKSFKSIIDQTVNLGQLNVFIGSNGAGKSNFLEAIAMLSSAVDGRIDYSKLADRGARLSAPEIFKSSFKNIKRKKNFSIEAKFGDLEYHANIHANNEVEFKFHSEKLDRVALDGAKEKKAGRSNAGVSILGLEKSLLANLSSQQSIVSTLESLGRFDSDELKEIQSIQRYAIYSLSTPILRGVSEDSSKKEPLGLYGGSLASALHDVIKEVKKSPVKHDLHRFFTLFGWIKTIGTDNDISSELQSKHLHTGKNVVKYVDNFMRENFNSLYAYDVSEGALYILFILVLLLHSRSPTFFALDNVDSALNPGMVRKAMEEIAALLEKMPDKQVLMTTHNPTTLDAVDLFNPLHRLFVVKRNSQGHTEIKQIKPPDGFTRRSWMDKYGGMKLSEIWLSGLIGGGLEMDI
jgi:predicted ATPase